MNQNKKSLLYLKLLQVFTNKNLIPDTTIAEGGEICLSVGLVNFKGRCEKSKLAFPLLDLRINMTSMNNGGTMLVKVMPRCACVSTVL